tara:strand:+ start:420 stop:620 length:201 start_codon:yes stop_codon:yes gene_type:complete
LIALEITYLPDLLNDNLALYSADLPWPDLKRNKVGNPRSIAMEVRSIALRVKELTPSSEVANAKII